MRKLLPFAALLVAASLATPLLAQGKAFAPTRSIDWTVTSSPGGGSDIYTRILADILTKEGLVNGKPFVIVNKTDGGGEVGRLNVSRIAKGPVADVSLLTFNSGDLMPMVKNTANRIQNFTPIALLAVDKQLIYVTPDSRFRSFGDVIAAVKAGTNVVMAGSKGDDVATYQLLLKEIGFTQDQLPYITNDATSGAITAVLGGHVDLLISKPAAADQYVAAGKLLPILALSKTRFTGNLASAPTLSEIGSYKDVEFPVWRGIVAPKTMSAAAVKYWSEVFKKVSESPAWQNDYLAKYKLQSAYMPAAEAAAYMSQFQADYLKSLGLDK